MDGHKFFSPGVTIFAVGPVAGLAAKAAAGYISLSLFDGSDLAFSYQSHWKAPFRYPAVLSCAYAPG